MNDASVRALVLPTRRPIQYHRHLVTAPISAGVAWSSTSVLLQAGQLLARISGPSQRLLVSQLVLPTFCNKSRSLELIDLSDFFIFFAAIIFLP